MIPKALTLLCNIVGINTGELDWGMDKESQPLLSTVEDDSTTPNEDTTITNEDPTIANKDPATTNEDPTGVTLLTV